MAIERRPAITGVTWPASNRDTMDAAAQRFVGGAGLIAMVASVLPFLFVPSAPRSGASAADVSFYSHQGQWNGQQILSQSWVTESTTPAADNRSWKDDLSWQQAGGYYKYGWWGLNNPNGTYDYFAWGKQGQHIYVSPSTNTCAGIGLPESGTSTPMRSTE